MRAAGCLISFYCFLACFAAASSSTQQIPLNDFVSSVEAEGANLLKKVENSLSISSQGTATRITSAVDVGAVRPVRGSEATQTRLGIAAEKARAHRKEASAPRHLPPDAVPYQPPKQGEHRQQQNGLPEQQPAVPNKQHAEPKHDQDQEYRNHLHNLEQETKDRERMSQEMKDESKRSDKSHKPQTEAEEAGKAAVKKTLGKAGVDELTPWSKGKKADVEKAVGSSKETPLKANTAAQQDTQSAKVTTSKTTTDSKQGTQSAQAPLKNDNTEQAASSEKKKSKPSMKKTDPTTETDPSKKKTSEKTASPDKAKSTATAENGQHSSKRANPNMPARHPKMVPARPATASQAQPHTTADGKGKVSDQKQTAPKDKQATQGKPSDEKMSPSIKPTSSDTSSEETLSPSDKPASSGSSAKAPTGKAASSVATSEVSALRARDAADQAAERQTEINHDAAIREMEAKRKKIRCSSTRTRNQRGSTQGTNEFREGKAAGSFNHESRARS